MDMMEAIEKRVSRRGYEDRPPDAEAFGGPEGPVRTPNGESGPHFQRYGPHGAGGSWDLGADAAFAR